MNLIPPCRPAAPRVLFVARPRSANGDEMPVFNARLPGRLRRVGLAFLLLAFFPGCDLTRVFNLEPNDLKSERAAAKKPMPPNRFSFRQPPYTFSFDFELKRDHPLFKNLEGLRDQ